LSILDALNTNTARIAEFSAALRTRRTRWYRRILRLAHCTRVGRAFESVIENIRRLVHGNDGAVCITDQYLAVPLRLHEHAVVTRGTSARSTRSRITASSAIATDATSTTIATDATGTAFAASAASATNATGAAFATDATGAPCPADFNRAANTPATSRRRGIRIRC
jgi:hypothetical protein